MFFYKTQKQIQPNKLFSFSMANHLGNCVVNHSFIEIQSSENTQEISSYIKTVKNPQNLS